jgi:hypothetical protein
VYFLSILSKRWSRTTGPVGEGVTFQDSEDDTEEITSKRLLMREKSIARGAADFRHALCGRWEECRERRGWLVHDGRKSAAVVFLRIGNLVGNLPPRPCFPWRSLHLGAEMKRVQWSVDKMHKVQDSGEQEEPSLRSSTHGYNPIGWLKVSTCMIIFGAVCLNLLSCMPVSNRLRLTACT